MHEPYTGPTEVAPEDNSASKEPKTDDMEEKDLRLDELLKDHIGEEIYSPTFGIVKVTLANCNAIGVISPWNNAKRTFDKDGRYWDKSDAVVSLYPSREAYLKYPLDAKKAWNEWQESQIRYRVRITLERGDNDEYAGDYVLSFNNIELALQAAEAVKKCLEDLIPERIDWNTLQSYCDDMYYNLEKLIDKWKIS